MIDLLARIPGSGHFRKIAVTHGGEWHGPCPLCGGRDRFVVWPHRTDGKRVFFCRQCEAGGDLIDYLRQVEGMSFREAAELAGKTVDVSPPMRDPSVTRRSEVRVAETRDTSLVWSDHAGRLVEWARGRLSPGSDAHAFLLRRGISREIIDQYRLGVVMHHRGDLYRERQAWGLPVERHDDGREKKLWIPQGIVIPLLRDGRVVRVRIRRWEGEPRYYVIPGSASDRMCIDLAPRRPWRVVVIVESELDALMLASVAGDLAGYVALGSAQAAPDAGVLEMFRSRHGESVRVVSALDADEAGDRASEWWEKTHRALRLRPSSGKDPGDMFFSGADVRGWIEEVMPPAYRLSRSAPPRPARDEAVGDGLATDEGESGATGMRIVDPATGEPLEFVVVSDGETFREMGAPDGPTVFSEGEMERIVQSGIGVSGFAQIIRWKRAIQRSFGAAYIREVTDERRDHTGDDRGQAPGGVPETPPLGRHDASGDAYGAGRRGIGADGGAVRR